jgi:hypothetical protein
VKRILVTGSRDWTDVDRIRNYLLLYSGGRGTVLVHGKNRRGADKIAHDIASHWPWEIEPHPADWTAPCRDTCRPGHRRRRWDGAEYCPAAGNYRNQEMVDLGADICLGFLKTGAANVGTLDCVRRAGEAGIRVIRVTGA